MQLGVWGRLTLQWQAAIAVLVPCVAVALFASLYFPARLNAQAKVELQNRARALGTLAVAEIAPTLRLIDDQLAAPEDLDKVFRGIAEGGSLDYVGALSLPEVGAVLPPSVRVSPEGTELIRSGKALGKTDVGAPPVGEYVVPEEGCSLDDRENHLIMSCLAKDGQSRGLLLAGFRKDGLRKAQEENQRAGLTSLLIAAVGGFILAFLFSRALARPVAMVTQAARELAAGDVTVSAVQVSAGGEIRSMAASFNEMLGSLRGLVSQMVSLTGRLSEASQGLIGASTDQENVTSQQAAYAQQIAATFEELSRTAERISASTEVVEVAARRTNEAVEEGRAVVASVVAEITQIRQESKAVADAITKLNVDLQQVSKMASVINQVAERSDLLALNAALEGTKAGEVGRGFSLVAAEMRKLAENVSVSARDIGRLVERIHESGNEAVSKANIGVVASDKGVQVAERASSVFGRIVEFARGTTEAAQQISIATRQQLQSSEQAVVGARNVADLVKRGVDATGRTTRIAHDLQSVSQALADVTGKFKVDRPQPRS